jgi:cyclase
LVEHRMSENELHVTPVRESVRVFTLGGDSIATSYGANCTAVAGRESVLLVDPLIAPAYARRIEAAVASWTPLPIRYILLTHHHTDHALGAGYFAAKGVTVVAQVSCRDRMATEHAGLIESRRRQPHLAGLFADAEAYLPAVVFERDFTFDLGDTQARALHPGLGHTPGDAIVHLAEESVAICGDLVSSGYHVNYEDATVANLKSGLELLRSLGARTYVPGHGSPGGTELLDDQAVYHRTLRVLADRAGDQTEFSSLARGAYPGFLLEEVLPAGRMPLASRPARET